MDRQLPARANLEQLKKQAKDLLSTAKAGETEALARLSTYSTDSPPVPSLHWAQLTIAREYGFPSWPRLAEHVEFAASDPEAKIQRFIRAAFCPDPSRALRLLAQEPALATASLATACILGDRRGVESAVSAAPSALNGPTDYQGYIPLMLAAGSAFLNAPDYRPRVLETIRWMLDHGADPNEYARIEDNPDGRMGPLYAASGVSHDPEVTELLLKAGADPNDNESMYHSTEAKDFACTRLLLDYHAKIAGTNGFYRMLDFENLPLHRMFLEHPTFLAEKDQGLITLESGVFHALKRGRSAEVIGLLLEKGANPNAKDAHGRSALRIATRFGNAAVAQLLLDHGARDDLTPGQRLIAAATRSDLNEARRILSEEPSALDQAKSDSSLLAENASVPNWPGVKCLIEIGFPVDGQAAEYRATALHWAGLKGNAEIAKLLIDRGSPVNVQDSMYKANPLNWALWGAQQNPDPGGQYREVILTLLEAGTELTPHIQEDEEVESWLAPYRNKA